MARYVEMGIIKPQEQSGDRVVGIAELNKEEPRITTRQATSVGDDGSESPLDHVEYVVQPERSASPQAIPRGADI